LQQAKKSCIFAPENGIQSEKRGRAVPSFFVLAPACHGSI
jgi:hypothetical protein